MDHPEVRGYLLSPMSVKINEAAGQPAHLALVLGGARSGKSRHAEGLLSGLAPPWIYIATGQPFDAEMQIRIEAHRARRDAAWRTVEAPLRLAAALDAAAAAPVLVDCLTLWLSNLILAQQDLPAAFGALELALQRRTAPSVLVSSEVGLGIVPENALARRFRDEAGLLHQRLAARADHVVLLAAGLPLVLKSRPAS